MDDRAHATGDAASTSNPSLCQSLSTFPSTPPSTQVRASWKATSLDIISFALMVIFCTCFDPWLPFYTCLTDGYLLCACFDRLVILMHVIVSARELCIAAYCMTANAFHRPYFTVISVNCQEFACKKTPQYFPLLEYQWR